MANLRIVAYNVHLTRIPTGPVGTKQSNPLLNSISRRGALRLQNSQICATNGRKGFTWAAVEKGSNETNCKRLREEDRGDYPPSAGGRRSRECHAARRPGGFRGMTGQTIEAPGQEPYTCSLCVIQDPRCDKKSKDEDEHVFGERVQACD